jgi:hypothetical protein
MSELWRRVPLLRLPRAEDVFDLEPRPVALLVDVEGTLTGFAPSPDSVAKSLSSFDKLATRRGLDLLWIHYVTNAGLDHDGASWTGMSTRLHRRAHKPFFSPPKQFILAKHRTVVVGDQYLTDGLLAWRFGFSFAFVSASQPQPTWPRVQSATGRFVSALFFKETGGC